MIQPRRGLHSAPARKLGSVAADAVTQRPACDPEEYCECGRVLARDNTGPLCSPCERAREDAEIAELQAALERPRGVRGPSPDIDYDAVTAYARAGLNNQEIAVALGIHADTVNKHFQRQRRKARRELGYG